MQTREQIERRAIYKHNKYWERRKSKSTNVGTEK